MTPSLKTYEITFVYVVPQFLFLAGLLIFPIGVVFWLVGLVVYGSAKAYVKNEILLQNKQEKNDRQK